MTERSTVTVGPWPEHPDADELDGSDIPAELVSMTTGTFEKLVDELGRQSEDNARLRAALAVRPSVSLATGVLMCRYGVKEDEALDLLVRWSGQRRAGLRDFACALLEVAARDPELLEVDVLGAPPRPAP